VKHLVDLDDDLLAQARAALHTKTIKDTVNTALELAARRRRLELDAAVDQLAELVETIPITDRADAW
jgi:Arc/MetJ family transcription regulator